MAKFDVLTNKAGHTLMPVKKTDKYAMMHVQDTDVYFIGELEELKDQYGITTKQFKGGPEWETSGSYLRETEAKATFERLSDPDYTMKKGKEDYYKQFNI